MRNTLGQAGPLVGALIAGVIVGLFIAPNRSADAPPGPQGVEECSRRLAKIEDGVQAINQRLQAVERHLKEDGARRASEAGTTAPAPIPSAAPGTQYSSLSDDEMYAFALSKSENLEVLKAALQRELPTDKRARLLLYRARVFERFERCSKEHFEALQDVLDISPVSAVPGAEASLDLAFAYSALPTERWRNRAIFEDVFRNAPTEELQMKGAYGLAWLHDLGDDPPEVPLASFREFLAKWGDKWAGTPEVQWARHRVQELESSTK